MGKWSDDKSVDVANSQGVPMSNVAWDTSGDVGCVSVLYEVRVGVLGLFIVPLLWSITRKTTQRIAQTDISLPAQLRIKMGILPGFNPVATSHVLGAAK